MTVQLSEVVRDLADRGVRHDLTGEVDPQISHVTDRDGDVVAGSLFCCVVGSRVDGHDLAAGAVERGAVALVVERPLPLDVPQVVVESVRACLGPLAAAFFDHPSRALRVVGITGTNGKTTTAAMVDAIMGRAGVASTVFGTLTSASGQPPTTPDPITLQRRLAAVRDDGGDVVVLEVSSHALAMHRVAGVRFAVVVFTTLGTDHLDFHGSQEAYFEAKASLFTPGFSRRAVIRADGGVGGELLERAEADGLICTPVRLDDAADIVHGPTGTTFHWRGRTIGLPLSGVHNVANALTAAATATILGVDAEQVVAGLESVGSVPGRFERIDRGQSFTVVVDYAHTPDALTAALDAARSIVDRDGRVLVVFGCGGDKDRHKRPSMGAVAAELADVAVITSDNPRSEAPEAIVEEILAGVPASARDRVTVVVDRAAAIHHALRAARDHDVVVIAGKGHETEQELADRTIPFDDRVVAADALIQVVKP